jgi:serine/threonine protein phosphatase 1
LIFLGDYIDRGPDSKGVIDFLLELMSESENIQCLMGNHESMFLDFLSGLDISTFLINGGESTLRSYYIDGETIIPQEHIHFINNLQILVELQDYCTVHAGFRPGLQIKDQSIDDMIWIREPFIYSKYDFGKKIIFGHTVFYDPLIMDNKIGLDTGAVYGNKLTCLELPDLVFHSVES